jgi:thiamine pyrophosphokinase
VDFSQREGDFVICCDAGLQAAQKWGISPDLIVGDFDSAEPPAESDVPVLRFLVMKDNTDSMLAAREGLRRGFEDFVLLFSLGGRLDHTVANIQTLAFLKEHGAQGALIGPRDTVRLLRNEKIHIPRREGRTLSVFAYEGQARGVTLKGVLYPLVDATLDISFPLGVGNHVTAPKATVSVADGTLLLIESQLN